MKALILVPRDPGPLQDVAVELQDALRGSGAKVVNVACIADIRDEAVLEAGILVFAVPSLNGDICWPVQVAVDALVHRVRHALDGVAVSGFTILPPGCRDNCPGLAPVLWAFNDTRAVVVAGLELDASVRPDATSERIGELARSLAGAGKK